MNTYQVFFEMYGKKMKIEIDADSHFHAQRKVEDSIRFHKISQIVKMPKPPFDEDETLEHLKNIFGMK